MRRLPLCRGAVIRVYFKPRIRILCTFSFAVHADVNVRRLPLCRGAAVRVYFKPRIRILCTFSFAVHADVNVRRLPLCRGAVVRVYFKPRIRVRCTHFHSHDFICRSIAYTFCRFRMGKDHFYRELSLFLWAVYRENRHCRYP